MMKFETIRDNLEILLNDNATSGKYRVIGYQKTSEDAEKAIEDNRFITVYYSGGEFPKTGGVEAGGIVNHDMDFTVELTVSQPTRGDITTLNNESATPAQLIAALSGFKDACRLADRSLDDFFNIIYNIIMDSRNRDLGNSFNLGSRWISNITKGQPIDMQKYVTISGTMNLSILVDENPSGDLGLEGEDIVVGYDINEDPVQETEQKFTLQGS